MNPIKTKAMKDAEAAADFHQVAQVSMWHGPVGSVTKVSGFATMEALRRARDDLTAAAKEASSSGLYADADRALDAVMEVSAALEQAREVFTYVEGQRDLSYEAERLQREETEAYVRLVSAEKARQRLAEEQAAASGASDSWQPVELAPYLSGEVPEVTPTVLRRDDGQALFYPGSNGLFGDSGAGKSLVSCFTVFQEITAGHVCVWLDYEETTPATTVARLLQLGADPDAIADRLVWLHPATAATPELLGQVAATAQERAGDRPVSLVIVDSVGEALAVEGLNEDKDTDTGPWLKRMKTLNDQLPEAALIFIDHSTKASQGSARLFPSGSKRKRASMTGAMWLVESIEAFAKGKAGSVQLVCAKDRHGHFAREEIGARISIAPGPDDSLTMLVQAPLAMLPVPGANDLWPLVAQAVALCKKAPEPLTTNDLTKDINGKASTERKRQAVNLAVQAGALSRTKKGQRQLHSFVQELTHADFLKTVQMTAPTVPDDLGEVA